jgi:hypothetical protein
MQVKVIQQMAQLMTMNVLSPPIYLRQIQIPIFPLPRHFSLIEKEDKPIFGSAPNKALYGG